MPPRRAHGSGKRRKAQDEVWAGICQSQREALLIECSAMALFASEYDAAESHLQHEGVRRKMFLGQLYANVDAMPADERAESIAVHGDSREG